MSEKLLVYMEKIRTLKSEREELRIQIMAEKEKYSHQERRCEEERQNVATLERRIEKIESEKNLLLCKCQNLELDIENGLHSL